MLLTFDEGPHVYSVDGVPVPVSVTGVLQRGGLIDFSGVPAAALAAARHRGSTVHAAIHYYNEHDLDVALFFEQFPDYAPYFQAWLTFCEQCHFVPVLNEHRVYSPRHHIAGTIDCLGTLNGAAVLLDFATGRPEDVAKHLQTAAYYGFALEWAAHDEPLAAFFAKWPIVKRYAVQLRRDARFALRPYTMPTDYRDFLSYARRAA